MKVNLIKEDRIVTKKSVTAFHSASNEQYVINESNFKANFLVSLVRKSALIVISDQRPIITVTVHL